MIKLPSISVILFFMSIFIIFSCGSSKNVGSNKIGVIFEKSNVLAAVLDKAALEDKLVFVDFYADWCMPCKMMEQDVFSDSRVAEFMNQNFINYKVDVETNSGSDLSYLYEVKGLPTLLFLDAKGKVLVRKMGAAYHTELRQLGVDAMLMKP